MEAYRRANMSTESTAASFDLSEDRWKEQFGFVSGTIIILGLTLLGLWRYAAMFQTGTTVHFLSSEWITITTPSILWFLVVTSLLALGMSSLFFSAVYVFYRALWLGLSPVEDRTNLLGLIRAWLERRAKRSYIAVLSIWLFIVIVILLGMLEMLFGC